MFRRSKQFHFFLALFVLFALALGALAVDSAHAAPARAQVLT